MNLIASQGTMRIESDGPSFSVAPTRPLLRHLAKPSLLNSRTDNAISTSAVIAGLRCRHSPHICGYVPTRG